VAWPIFLRAAAVTVQSCCLRYKEFVAASGKPELLKIAEKAYIFPQLKWD
jgi:hypothetical protein